MKTTTMLLVAAFWLILSSFNVVKAAGSQPQVGNQFAMTVASSGTPAQLTNSTTLRARAITIKARKDRGTANTGVIYIGWTSTNDAQLYVLASDGEVVITPPEGSNGYLRLSDIYIDVVTNGDGVVVTWFNTD